MCEEGDEEVRRSDEMEGERSGNWGRGRVMNQGDQGIHTWIALLNLH